VAKLSWLLWAVLVFVAKPALAENFTYKQYSASVSIPRQSRGL
jgi:hypothetical protein